MLPKLRTTLNELSPGLRWVMAVIGVGFFANGVRTAMLPLYLIESGISPRTIGLFFSFWTLCVIFGDLFWGWLLDRFPARWTLLGGSLIFGLTNLGFLLASSLPQWYLVFLLYGITWAPIFLLGRWYVGVYGEPQTRTADLAQLAIVASSTTMLGSLLGGWVADVSSLRSSLILTSAPLLLLGFCVLLSWKRLDYPAHPERTPGPDMGRGEGGAYHRILALIGGVAALIFMAYGSQSIYLPILASQVYGSSPAGVGFLSAMQGTVVLLMVLPMGRLADRRGKGKLILYEILIICAALLALPHSPNFSYLVLASCALALGFNMFLQTSASWLSDRVPQARQGAAMGRLAAIEDTGWMFGPALGGLLWESSGYRALFLIAAGIAGLTLLIWLIGGHYKPRPLHPVFQGLPEHHL